MVFYTGENKHPNVQHMDWNEESQKIDFSQNLDFDEELLSAINKGQKQTMLLN